MDHIVSDGCSLALLLNEIWTAYAQRVNGHRIDLPKIGMQFAEYALRQRAQSRSILETARYRNSYFNASRLPVDLAPTSNGGHGGWGCRHFWIDQYTLAELRKWVRTNRTTLVMAVFTAYVAAVLRWANIQEAVVQFMIDGRMSAEIDHTIGYFAFPIFVNVTLGGGDRFVDLVKSLTGEYCKALDAADFGLSQSESPRPQYTRSASFNWLPSSYHVGSNQLGHVEHAVRHSRLDVAVPIPDTVDGDADYDPAMVISERDDGLLCEVRFPRCRFSSSGIDRLARQMTRSLAAMINAPESRVAGLQTE